MFHRQCRLYVVIVQVSGRQTMLRNLRDRYMSTPSIDAKRATFKQHCVDETDAMIIDSHVNLPLQRVCGYVWLAQLVTALAALTHVRSCVQEVRVRSPEQTSSNPAYIPPG